MNKYFIVLGLVLVAQLANANTPANFLGTYFFSPENLAVVQTQHQLSISVKNDEARKFVQGLMEKSYQCLMGPGSITKCKKFDRSISEDSDLRQGLVAEFSGQPLNFEISNSGYELVNEAPALKEYQKSQNSSFDTTLFNKLHVYVLTDGPTKLKLYSTNHQDQAHFYINESGQLAKQVNAVKINKKQNANVIEDRTVYLYEANWKL